jgi:predicted AAA+ superfamily ATPase
MNLHREYYFWQDSNSHEVDILLKTNSGFDIYEIKATETIKPSLFEKMNYFEELAKPAKVNKTLIYGGNKDQKRSNYKISSWMP